MSTTKSFVRSSSHAPLARRILGAGFVCALLAVLAVGALAPAPVAAVEPHCPYLLLGQCPFQGIIYVGPVDDTKQCCVYRCPWGQELGPCESTMAL